ncbi:C39 family peptidase [Deinococcus roseus]|uniref:Peptidase C39-like domain-containing protein n=1 Tax=Deinococcus roseus TaxID=392414 RepID=A0ABQ2D5G7_9DEIO|nr:C39 family peptidase [Deinococcus roseus]GGJ46883.1 hypothetical protein GCM10008938_36270 [Deinococcus roseus]
MPIPEPILNEVLRAALLAQFSRSKKPVVLLVAPSGYGKTVAVAQWMRIQKSPCVWITDRKASTSSERVLQELLRQLQGLLGWSLKDPSASLEAVFDVLEEFQDLPLKLVFDGLGGYTPEALHMVARVCRHLPEPQQVILCSRSPKLLGFQQLFSKQQIEVFKADQLAFNLQECALLLGRPYTAEEHQKSQGWCQEVSNQHLGQFVYDPKAYISELVQELPDGVTAVLSALLQKEVWKESDFAQPDILWKLLEAGLPLLPTDLLHYRLHPLLQEWLLDQQDSLEWPSGALDVAQIQQRIRRLLATQQLDTLLPWLEKTMHDWLRQDQFDEVVAVMETLDTRTLTPFLRTALAEAHLELAHLETSERMLLELAQDQVPISRTFVNLARIAVSRDRLEECRHMLEQAKSLAMDPEDELRVACQEVLYHRRLGDLQKALEMADHCVTLARSTGLQEMLITSHCRVAYIERLLGHPQAVEYHASEALRFARHLGLVNRAAPAVNALADLQKDLGQYQKALENLNGAIGAMSSKHPYKGVLHATRSLVYLEIHKFPEALQDMQESLRLYETYQNRFAALLPASLICYVLYRQGKLEELNAHFALFEHQLKSHPISRNLDGRQDHLPLFYGIYHYANGRKRQALLALNELVVNRQNGGLDVVLLAQLFRCKVKHELKKATRQDADVLLEVIGHRDSGIMLGMHYDAFSGVLDHFMEQGWHTETLKALIQQSRPQFNAIQKIHLEMLDKPRLWIGQREVKVPNFYPLMALIYLHLHRGRYSSSVHIADHLWREDLQDRQTRSNRVSAAFSMLKKILREVDALYEDLILRDPREGWMLHEKFEVTSDLDLYMDWDHLSMDTQMDLLHKLPAQFFSTINTDWAETVREQLRASAAYLAREIAGDLAIKGKMQEALDVLELGLRIDPHAFELMEQGINYARAARQFQRAAELSQLLNQEVGKNMPLKHQRTQHNLQTFRNCTLQHLQLDGGVVLQTDCNAGTLISAEIPCDPFTSMILSWNARAPTGSMLEFSVRVKVAGEWSGDYSFGEWSEASRNSRRGQKDQHGHMDTDVLKLFTPATAYQYCVTFSRQTDRTSPLLHDISVLTTGEQDEQSSAPAQQQKAWGLELQVPSMSQLTYEEGAGWCSPTCLKMVLGFHGVETTVPELAQRVYDGTYRGTGNWVFNTAAVAAFGMKGHVNRLASLNEAETYIARGIPLIISISWKDGELHGAPLPRSAGHLLLLAGFTENGDVIVRDPAAVHVAEVRRIYRRRELQQVWLRHSQGMCYVIEPVVADKSAPQSRVQPSDFSELS